MRYLASLLFIAFKSPAFLAQDKPPQQPYTGINADIAEMMRVQQQKDPSTAKRSITLPEAVSIFLQQNLQIVVARFDVEIADAEKLTARLRPNPEFDASF